MLCHRIRGILITAVAAALLLACCAVQALSLYSQGNTRYSIVVAGDAADEEQFAAKDLAEHLNKISGAEFKVVTEKSAGSGPFIFVGYSGLLESRTGISAAETRSLESEELLVRTCGDDLVLVGGRPRGTLYAVYYFLEDLLGCHWLTPEVTVIPKKSDLDLPPLNHREKPAFEYRSPGYKGYREDALYSVRNRVNDIREQKSTGQYWPGGRMDFVTARGWHTFASLVPADRLMPEHPDWFSNGTQAERFQGTGQLCLTNPEVDDYVVNVLREQYAARPYLRLASVTQNDNNNYCKCSRCSEAARTKGQSGLMIDFANRIARRISAEFPQAIIVTFAYSYTQEPPLDKTIKADDNVAIYLTTEGPSRSIPLRESSIKDRLVEWSKVCRNIYIWNYEGNYTYPIAPMPNLYSMGDNYRWFQENNVRGALSEGIITDISGEFAHMRGWIAAKLMWNPKQNENALIDIFLQNYYGKDTAPYIREYLDYFYKATQGQEFNIYTDVTKSAAFPWRAMLESERIFDKAEAAASANPLFLARVKQARTQVDYMVVLRGREYAREAEKAGIVWPKEYYPDARGKGIIDTAETTGLSKEWEALDAEWHGTWCGGALGQEGGTWRKFRDENMNLLSDDTLARLSVLSNAVAEATRSYKLELAEKYLNQIKASVKERRIRVMQAADIIDAPYIANHKPGRFSDWDSISVSGSFGAREAQYGRVDGDGDCSGTFKLAWNDKYAFVLVDVTDDKVISIGGASAMWSAFGDDHVQLFFNIMNDEGLAGADGVPSASYGPDDFMTGVSAGGYIYPTGSNPLLGTPVPGTVVKHKLTKDGYLLEVALPWKGMFLDEAVPGYTVGFTMMVGDCDKAGSGLEGTLVWKGSTPYNNTRDWATMRLVGK